MGSGLGGVADMSTVGGFASSLANNNPYATGPATLGLNSSQMAMYSYPMSMGGFVPPHSRPYVSGISYLCSLINISYRLFQRLWT
jgi:hypothetical protein